MDLITFLEGNRDLTSALPGEYNLFLVSLSIIIACVAAYAALGLSDRIRASEKTGAMRLWLAAGALAMGIGVWAMHFIGMLAFELPIKIAYDVGITLVSMLPAMVAGGIVLFVISRPKIGKKQILVGGTLMGLGIGAMHYIGMAAMLLPAEMRYHPGLFAVSIIVAVFLAMVALYINLRATNEVGLMRLRRTKIGAALVLGLSIAAMHYTGMASVYFFPGAAPRSIGFALDPMLLSILISVAVFLILALTIVVVVVDTRLQDAALMVRLSRSRMIDAVESIAEAFSLYDSDDKLVLCNSKYKEFFNLEKIGVRPGMKFEQVIRRIAENDLVPEAKNRIDEWAHERLARHHNPTEPYIERQADGRWLQINEHKTDDGATVAVYTDITPIKQAEADLKEVNDALHAKNEELTQALEELKAAQNQLIESAKLASLGRITAGIAHEINNPLGALSSTIDILARCVAKMKELIKDPKTFPNSHGIQEIHKLLGVLENNSQIVFSSNDRIRTIVNSLKTFVRLDEADFKETDIHEGIESSLTLLQHDFGSHVNLVKKYGEIPDIYCNPVELNQVFMTLLRNAIEAIEEKGEVTITTSASKDKVSVEIKDSGKGIPEDEIESLFDFGFISKGPRVGFRTGLFNVYNTIQKHQGNITVKSMVNRGTTFTISLPVMARAN